MLACDLPPVPPAPPGTTPESILARRAADARRLSERLLQGGSAVRLLLEWCEERGIGEGPIRAVPAAGVGEATPPELLGQLEAMAGDVVRHRRVVLTRDGTGLSDCDLWWLPDRLPAALGEALDATDHPFDLVVAPLQPRRWTIFSEAREGRHLLEHLVIVEVSREEGYRPVAAVRERYRVALSPVG